MDEIRTLAPALGLEAADVDVADARYRVGHMADLFQEERHELTGSRR
ncbi:hypothetical protein [Streptomyces sp. NPDC018045]